jgi:hypothetical protein
MNIEKKFQQLVAETTNFKSNKYVSKNIDNHSALDKFYKDKLELSPFRRRNGQILLKHLGTMLKLSNQENIEWLGYKAIYSQEKFMETLAASIDKYSFPMEISELFQQLYTKIDNENLRQNIFTADMNKKLVEMNLSSNSYARLYSMMTNAQRNNLLEQLLSNNININYSKFLPYNDTITFIKNNIDIIYTHGGNIIDIKRLMELKREDKFVSKINAYIDNNPYIMVNSIIDILKTKILNNKKINFNKYRSFIFLLLDEISKNESTSISSTEFIGTGGYSAVFAIKTKVIKIGIERKTPHFPNNPYILKPLLRKTITIDNIPIFFEVIEKVDTNINDITKEEIYKLYKNIREIGLIWTDVKIDNVGRLIKDNKIYWYENITPSDETLEFTKTIGNHQLKKGELIVLDGDYIYNENDHNINSKMSNLQTEFEKTYQKELKKRT